MGLQEIWTEIKRWALFFGCYTHLRNIRLFDKKTKKTILVAPVLENNCYLNDKLRYPFPFACVAVSPLKFMHEQYAIYVNSLFLTVFNEEERWAAYMHEMGHIFYKHVEDKSEDLNYLREFEADAFACHRGCAKGLKSSLQIYERLVKSVAPQEEWEDWLPQIHARLQLINRYLEEHSGK